MELTDCRNKNNYETDCYTHIKNCTKNCTFKHGANLL